MQSVQEKGSDEENKIDSVFDSETSINDVISEIMTLQNFLNQIKKIPK